MDRRRTGPIDHGPGTLHRSHAVELDLDSVLGWSPVKLGDRLFQPFLFLRAVGHIDRDLVSRCRRRRLESEPSHGIGRSRSEITLEQGGVLQR